MDFGKLLTAMVTPFDQNGDIDFQKTTELIEFLIENKTEGLVIAGTTGESPTLTPKEKLELFKHVVQVVDKRIPVLAGTGSNNTKHDIEFSKDAEAIGIDGLLIVTPYYNKPSQEGLYQHYKSIAEHTDLPVMLYNIPGRSVVRIDVSTIVKLSKIDNVVAVKDSTGDLDAISYIIEQTDDDFLVYSGDDSMTLPILSVGGHGVVSVASHVIGQQMKDMILAFEAGNVKKAAGIHRTLLPLMRGLFMAPSPTPVKEALKIKGIDTGSVRLPLVPLSSEEKEQLLFLLS